MKKIYNKPNMKCIKLLSAESLMTGSKVEKGIYDDGNTGGSSFLSNKESEHDIWGDDSSSMWK